MYNERAKFNEHTESNIAKKSFNPDLNVYETYIIVFYGQCSFPFWMLPCSNDTASEPMRLILVSLEHIFE